MHKKDPHKSRHKEKHKNTNKDFYKHSVPIKSHCWPSPFGKPALVFGGFQGPWFPLNTDTQQHTVPIAMHITLDLLSAK